MTARKSVTRRTIFKLAFTMAIEPAFMAELPPPDVPLWLWHALKSNSHSQRSGILRLGGGGAFSNTDWFLRRTGPP
jgi:hypothetical protein